MAAASISDLWSTSAAKNRSPPRRARTICAWHYRDRPLRESTRLPFLDRARCVGAGHHHAGGYRTRTAVLAVRRPVQQLLQSDIDVVAPDPRLCLRRWG